MCELTQILFTLMWLKPTGPGDGHLCTMQTLLSSSVREGLIGDWNSTL